MFSHYSKVDICVEIKLAFNYLELVLCPRLDGVAELKRRVNHERPDKSVVCELNQNVSLKTSFV